MQEQTEQSKRYEMIKEDYRESLEMIDELKGDKDEARRSKEILEK
jgi:hypothetical protein